MEFTQILKRVVGGANLTCDDAYESLSAIMEGGVSEILTASFLTAMASRPVIGEELAGLAMAMRRFAMPVSVSRTPVIDTCGTGGDRKGTFNISTTTALVCAGAGVNVAKHGNRSATSACGSADVLECLGVVIDLPSEKVAICIDEIGIGFLFARRFHPAMKFVAKIRSELPFPTVFNLLGPLCNPVKLDGQIIGIFSKDLLEPVSKALQMLGIKRGFVVWGIDGIDEVNIAGETEVYEITPDSIKYYQITPEEFGFRRYNLDEIKGGNVGVNAEIVRNVLTGEKSPYRDAVLLNSIPAIIASGMTSDWKTALEMSEQSIDSGKAFEKLQQLIDLTRRLANEVP
ncbi:MAG TPA: anthranilate phosphoribosyltransferase [Candidatus Hydrogenedens sp.]|nr:anthranilate phosphoribosyltransferase [Candidatus Hydrogenedens sp.]